MGLTCKNCSQDFNGTYCPNCGQEFRKQIESKQILSELLDAFDFRKGVLHTTFFLLIRPNRLITDICNGKTRPYIGPIKFLVIVFTIFFVISESKILGFEISAFTGSEFVILVVVMIPILIGSLIAGSFPFMKLKRIELIAINFYFFAASSTIFIVHVIVRSYGWIYEFKIPPYLLFLVPFTVYYFGSIFKLAIHKTALNLISIFLIVALLEELNRSASSDEVHQNLIFEELPFWVKVEIGDNSEMFHGFSKVKGAINKAIVADLNGNTVKEVALLMVDSNHKYYVAIFDFKERITTILKLNNASNAHICAEVNKWKYDEIEQVIKLSCENESRHINWNGYQFLVKPA